MRSRVLKKLARLLGCQGQMPEAFSAPVSTGNLPTSMPVATSAAPIPSSLALPGQARVSPQPGAMKSICTISRTSTSGPPNLARCSMSSETAAANIEYARLSRSDGHRWSSVDMDSITVNLEDACSARQSGASVRGSLDTAKSNVQLKGQEHGPALSKAWHSCNVRVPVLEPSGRNSSRAENVVDVWD